MLTPELDVTSIETSLPFYEGVLGFRVQFERAAERFVCLERDDVEVMLQEALGPGRRFRTAPLELPFGRGVNFQIAVDDVDVIHDRALASNTPIIVPMEERWYPLGVTSDISRSAAEATVRECGNRQLVLADPDGYLWRPFRDLGTRLAV